jgi:hypothetical protein
VPALNEVLEVHYRGVGRAMARIHNPASIAAQQHGIDDGLHGTVRHLQAPRARTSMDCENAALALLSDGATHGWIGAYETWSDFLPGAAQDIFFQCEVLEKLARLEAKMEMLVGGGQPGRMSLIEARVNTLERSEVRRSVYDRMVNAAITTALSALIAFHDRWWK